MSCPRRCHGDECSGGLGRRQRLGEEVLEFEGRGIFLRSLQQKDGFTIFFALKKYRPPVFVVGSSNQSVTVAWPLTYGSKMIQALLRRCEQIKEPFRLELMTSHSDAKKVGLAP